MRSLSTKDQTLSLYLRFPSHLFTLWNMGVVEGKQGTKKTRCLLTEAGFLPSKRGLGGPGSKRAPRGPECQPGYYCNPLAIGTGQKLPSALMPSKGKLRVIPRPCTGRSEQDRQDQSSFVHLSPCLECRLEGQVDRQAGCDANQTSAPEQVAIAEANLCFPMVAG